MSIIISGTQTAPEHHRAIIWTAQAMSTDETRYGMAGLLMVRTPENDVKLVATDGRRLHMAIIPAPQALSIGIMVDDLQPDEPPYTAHKVISRKKTELIIDGLDTGHQFPDYRRVIPEYGFSIPVVYGGSEKSAGIRWYYNSCIEAGQIPPIVNGDYILDVFAYGNAPKSIGNDHTDITRAISVYDPDDKYRREAVIMPMRREKHVRVVREYDRDGKLVPGMVVAGDNLA